MHHHHHTHPCDHTYTTHFHIATITYTYPAEVKRWELSPGRLNGVFTWPLPVYSALRIRVCRFVCLAEAFGMFAIPTQCFSRVFCSCSVYIVNLDIYSYKSVKPIGQALNGRKFGVTFFKPRYAWTLLYARTLSLVALIIHCIESIWTLSNETHSQPSQ